MRTGWPTAEHSTHQGLFTFPAASIPPCVLSFSPSSTTARNAAPARRLKRSRPLADVDGEGSVHVQKKKRRLRLDLITSRLSRPYATPSTHIVSRGASKIAIWARQKALGRTSLRKAAIMNRVRIKHDAVREAERKRVELGTQLYLPPTPSPAQKPHRQYIPLSPSPLGLSNYDALDQEGDPYSEDEHEDADVSSIYSDFNVLDSNEPVLDNYDSLASFDDALIEYEDTGQQRPPTPPREEIIKFVMEKERQKEVSFVDFGP